MQSHSINQDFEGRRRKEEKLMGNMAREGPRPQVIG